MANNVARRDRVRVLGIETVFGLFGLSLFVLVGAVWVWKADSLGDWIIGPALLVVSLLMPWFALRRTVVLRRGARVRLAGRWVQMSSVRKVSVMPHGLGTIPVVWVVSSRGGEKPVMLTDMRIGRRGEDAPAFVELKRLLELD